MIYYVHPLYISWLGVILSAVAAMVIGTLWYSPYLFGKQWMKIIGLTDKEMKQRSSKALVTLLLAALLTAYVLDVFINYASVFANYTWLEAGMLSALLAWAGFSLTTIVAHGIFEPRDKKLMVINIGNRLVTLLAMGLILGLFVK